MFPKNPLLDKIIARATELFETTIPEQRQHALQMLLDLRTNPTATSEQIKLAEETYKRFFSIMSYENRQQPPQPSPPT